MALGLMYSIFFPCTMNANVNSCTECEMCLLNIEIDFYGVGIRIAWITHVFCYGIKLNPALTMYQLF